MPQVEVSQCSEIRLCLVRSHSAGHGQSVITQTWSVYVSREILPTRYGSGIVQVCPPWLGLESEAVEEGWFLLLPVTHETVEST